MKDLSTWKEGIELRNTTEATELIIQIKSMLDTGTTQVKVWNDFSCLRYYIYWHYIFYRNGLKQI